RLRQSYRRRRAPNRRIAYGAHVKLFLIPFLAMALRAADPPVTALAFSPDGKILARGAYQRVEIWDAGTHRLLRWARRFAVQVRGVGFRDDHVVAGAAGVPGRSGSVSLLDLDSGGITPMQQANDEMLAVAFSPDGNLLATGGTDGVVRIFDGNGPKAELK